jgi:hypothetical protein
MTRDEWESAYARRMVDNGIEAGEAAACALSAADDMHEENGPDVSTWFDPADAAQDDMDNPPTG